MARLETSLVGILVLPFLGYSLRMVVPPLLLDELDEEERELLLRWVRVWVVCESRLLRRLRVRTTSFSRTRSLGGMGRNSSSP
jgi:hypothetical protein